MRASFAGVWILWKSYLVPRTLKSRSQCIKSPLFMENVEVLPGTTNTIYSTLHMLLSTLTV